MTLNGDIELGVELELDNNKVRSLLFGMQKPTSCENFPRP